MPNESPGAGAKRTEADAEFAGIIKTLGPDSSPRLIKRAFSLLRKDTPLQYQLGLQHIAEGCWLSVMHLIDAHMVSFVDDSTWSEGEYMGAAYCMPGDDEDWKAKLIETLPKVPGPGRLALFRDSVAKNHYTGAAKGKDQSHTLLKAPYEALLVLPVNKIPVGRAEDQRVLDASKKHHDSALETLQPVIDAARLAVEEVNTSMISWLFSGKRLPKLDALIAEAQRVHRLVDAKRTRVQARVYHSILTEVEPTHPITVEMIDSELFGPLNALVENVRDAARGLKLPA